MILKKPNHWYFISFIFNRHNKCFFDVEIQLNCQLHINANHYEPLIKDTNIPFFGDLR